jgi:hypothetical protein
MGMLARARRPIAYLCLALIAVQCTRIKQQEAQTVLRSSTGEVAMKKVVGVTLNDGRDIRFDAKSRSFVRGDSLQAQVGGERLAIPVSDVQRLWVQSVDNTRTSWLVLTILVAAFFAIGALAASQMSYAIP